MKSLFFALAMVPSLAFAGSLKVESPMVPLAPPSAKVHAAYMVLHNDSDVDKHLIGISADGYAMAHLHKSEEKDGVATMSAVHMIEIAAGTSVSLERGGLHIMLMQPSAPLVEGDHVSLQLEFSDGTTQPVRATVVKKVRAMNDMHHTHHHGS